jgi:hypothetical protein
MRTNDEAGPEGSAVDVRGLLALKRYEVPPPGYFNTFAAKVIARLEAGDPVESLSWWKRLVLVLSARPSLASGFALITGLSVLGALGVAPAVQSGSLRSDLMLGSAPVAVQTSLTEQPAHLITNHDNQPLYATASSVSPVLARPASLAAAYAVQAAQRPGGD